MATKNSVNTGLNGQTGSGQFVGDTSPTLVTPNIGTPSAGTLTNCTGLPVAGGGTGRATATEYAVLCGGTTTTGAHQSIASVGTSGQLLTSNGASSLPTFQTITRGLQSVQVFTANGTWTKPAGINTVIVEVVGGGGGGGSNDTGSGGEESESGSGGGGGYARKLIDVSGTSSVSVTVGSGGSGGTSGVSQNGSTGGSSSFGAFCSATGGAGGAGGVKTTGTNQSIGGAGGSGSGGDININGGYGSDGRVILGEYTGKNTGGASMLSTCARDGDSAPPNGNSYGGGGVGNSSVWPSAGAGGNGAPGIVIVYEYE